MAKSLTAIRDRELRQLARLEKQRAQPWTRLYYSYLVVLLSLIYIIDEITSNIGGSVQSSLVTEFFVQGRGMEYNDGLAAFSAISMAFMGLGILAPFYKSLSDRYGRKPFLAINTFGMGAGLFICYTAASLVQYLVGIAVSTFFVAHDMQVVYIMETAPPKWRGTIYATIKCVASSGIVLIPVLRGAFMGDDPSKWRAIFLIPALLGMAFGIYTLFGAKESPYFLEHRIDYLNITPAERAARLAEEGKKKDDKKSGIGSAFRFMFRHRQLRWLSITNLVFFVSAAAIGYYESIMSTGGMSTEQVTRALYVYPFVNAGLTLLNGFLADGIGRKKVAVVMSALCLGGFVSFIAGVALGWNPYLIGGFYGCYVGSFWAVGDIIGGIMCGESAPTELRASVMAAQTLLLMGSMAVSTIVMTVCLTLVDNIGMLCVAVMVPFMVASLIILMSRVHDTKGIDLNAVTGAEWD